MCVFQKTVLRKGDPLSVSNYRPISVISIVSKRLQHVLHKYIFNYLGSLDFFTPSQSGFITNNSTFNNIASLHHTFCLPLDGGKEVRSVSCNIAKAFDCACNDGLHYKLRHSGILGNLLL